MCQEDATRCRPSHLHGPPPLLPFPFFYPLAPMPPFAASKEPPPLVHGIRADHTISKDSFARYSTVLPYFKTWLKETSKHVEMKEARVADSHHIMHVVCYPDVLNEDGEPMLDEVIIPFFQWYSTVDKVQLDPIKWALKFFTACCQIERNKRGMCMLDAGVLNKHMKTRVMAKEKRHEQGMAKISTCGDTRKRVDKSSISFAQMTRMMELCMSGSHRISSNPLLALQTGAEVEHSTRGMRRRARCAKKM